ncbi:MAG: DUF1499 domain-containing protein [Oricola sp.]|jgi:uncharacterized protein (DUF1499 family)|nr:DUF1499 domain-containing protein [Oricola sp.]
MKILGLAVLVLVVAVAGGLIFLAQKSKSGSPPGIVGGKLAPCPSSPNCVSSEEGTDDAHRVAALSGIAWDRLPDLIQAEGGRIVERKDDYLAAEFSTKLMGFVDDVEFRKAEDTTHVRSASRVGRSDFGANRKRVEALRAALGE